MINKKIIKSRINILCYGEEDNKRWAEYTYKQRPSNKIQKLPLRRYNKQILLVEKLTKGHSEVKK